MSTPRQELERELKDLGVSVDLSEQAVAGDTTQTVRVCFHPWMEINNLDARGCKFNVPYPRLPRLAPILIPVFDAPRILPRKAPHGFLGALTPVDGDLGDGFGMSVPAAGTGGHAATVKQMPRTSVGFLLTGHKGKGMVELESLVSEGAAELRQRVSLFRAVFETPFETVVIDGAEASFRAVDLKLEALPDWLDAVAPDLLERAVREGSVPKSLRANGVRMIAEVKASVRAATDAALNESSGILPNTKAEMSAKHKLFLDRQDRWCLDQFPSFSLDTEVELAQRASEKVLRESSRSSEEFTATMAAFVQQNAEILREMAESRKQMTEMMRLVLAGRKA